MNPETLFIAGTLIPESYLAQAGAGLSSRRKLVKGLLSQRRMPQAGWDEASIENLMQVAAFITIASFQISKMFVISLWLLDNFLYQEQ